MEKTWQMELIGESMRVLAQFPELTGIKVADVRIVSPGNMFISIIANSTVFTGVGDSINSTIDALIANIGEVLNISDKQYHQLQNEE
ncbi:MAG: hypothetical protein LBV41_08565 [Cytophagaceae bacterium]|nr:hypothetical protein [Cytophagaceae bacterium]